jgi:hypothetical protein
LEKAKPIKVGSDRRIVLKNLLPETTYYLGLVAAQSKEGRPERVILGNFRTAAAGEKPIKSRPLDGSDALGAGSGMKF